MTKLYYTPSSDEQFDELKAKAIEIWQGYNNDNHYVDDKVSRIADIKNISDNFMYMVAMFDSENHKKLAGMLTSETREQVRLRMVDGGQPDRSNPF